jgi:hypothetical protein
MMRIEYLAPTLVALTIFLTAGFAAAAAYINWSEHRRRAERVQAAQNGGLDDSEEQLRRERARAELYSKLGLEDSAEQREADIRAVRAWTLSHPTRSSRRGLSG